MRCLALAIFVFALGLCAFGQVATTPTPTPSTEDQQKRAKLDALIQQGLDDAIANISSLRLPENRAIAYAMLGDMYWRFDQKRARELFRNVGPELSAFNAEMEKEVSDQNGFSPGLDLSIFAQDPRYQVIPLIARHDADLARQVMQQSRRAAIAQAIANGPPPAGPLAGTGSFSAYAAAQEVALEQQIAMYSVDQDPDAAIKAIRESMSKGVSYNVLPLLQKLEKIDEKKATDLGNEVVQKILDTDMVKNTDMIRTGVMFLTPALNAAPPKPQQGKQFSLTDAQQKDIANKLAATLMAMPSSLSSRNWFSQVIPLVDKFAPDKSAALKLRQAEVQKNMPSDLRGMLQSQELFNPNMTAEQIVAAIPKLPESSRLMAYSALMNKMSAVTDDAQAKRIIDQIPDEKVRDALQTQMDAGRVDRAIQTGKLDDARRQIAQITDRRRQIPLYVNLALAYNKSGKEADIEAAKSVMRDAKAQTTSFPETGDDLADLMQIVRGYASIEPESAFKSAEQAVDMINEYSQAAAVLSKYTKDGAFRNGEMMFRANGYPASLVFRYFPQFQMLGRADLERTNELLDRLSRADVRVIFRLYTLQGVAPESTAGQGSILITR